MVGPEGVGTVRARCPPALWKNCGIVEGNAAFCGTQKDNADEANCLSALDFVGRRDWTRTNDPHHVKVVL
jgi:hypothetical protein